ncbi:18277_t:CDS:10 [Entrophospora sp. SA101]|nr:18277_t:CDS:10 [Entrophospora sp. SA101]
MIDSACTKIMIEDCDNLVLNANSKILTSTIDVWKSNNIILKIHEKIQTIQVDECKNIEIVFNDPKNFYSIVWTNTDKIDLKILESDQGNDQQQNHIQYITRLFEDGGLKNEMLIRAEKGFPITKRELDDWITRNKQKINFAINNNSSSSVDSIQFGGCNSTIYCNGELLKLVQLSRIFDDSKTFVDMPTKKPVAEVLQAVQKLLTQSKLNPPTRSDVISFLSTYFDKEGQELLSPENYDDKHCTSTSPFSSLFPLNSKPDFLKNIHDPYLKPFGEIVHKLWKTLVRKVDLSFMCDGCVSSFIPLKNPFVIPGGRFREIYYWDGYFIIEGLLLSELYDLAKGMIENYLILVETYGFIPNGSRIYYLNRSQPPLLTQMVKRYYETTKDKQFLKRALPTLIKEYNFWHRNKTIGINHQNKRYTLNYYNVYTDQPRPESYWEDYVTAQQPQSLLNVHLQENNNDDRKNKLNESAIIELYSNIAAAAETGWDFSSRWANNYRLKPTTDSNNITDFPILPFRKKARNRLDAIKELFWDDELNLFMDFNLTSAIPAELSSNPFKLLKSYDYIKKLLGKYPGSLTSTLMDSGLQWDFPNSWPPLEYVVVKGLVQLSDKYYPFNANNRSSNGLDKYYDLASSISQRFVSSVFCAWYITGGSIKDLLPKLENTTDDGHIFEKYNTLTRNVPGGGGEYKVQTGFGWTNGVLLWMLNKFGDQLKVPGISHEN